MAAGATIKQGPWGGDGGDPWDMGPADQINSIKIYYGNDAIVGLDITYTVDGIVIHMVVGSTTGPYQELILWEGEYINSISGAFGIVWNNRVLLITQLTLRTNTGNSLAVVGSKGDSPFSLDNVKIVGFFGRAGAAIDAIGVYGQWP